MIAVAPRQASLAVVTVVAVGEGLAQVGGVVGGGDAQARGLAGGRLVGGVDVLVVGLDAAVLDVGVVGGEVSGGARGGERDADEQSGPRAARSGWSAHSRSAGGRCWRCTRSGVAADLDARADMAAPSASMVKSSTTSRERWTRADGGVAVAELPASG
jgi:hypothetical protein